MQGQGFKRVFLQALFTGDGSSSLLPRATIQVSYSTRQRAQLAKDVQLLLLEFGVVSRISRSARGELKVVVTNRRDARLFLRNVGFLGSKQAKLESRAGDSVPRESRALSSDHAPFVAGYIRCVELLVPERIATGSNATTSTGSSGGSRAERRSWSGSRHPR